MQSKKQYGCGCDILTKGLSCIKFEKLRTMAGVLPISDFTHKWEGVLEIHLR